MEKSNKKSIIKTFLFMSCFISFLMITTFLPTNSFSQEDQKTNPHGKIETTDTCLECHPSIEDIKITDVEQLRKLDETCTKCHPSGDLHLPKVPSKNVVIPASFPLIGGEIKCITCHDEPSCDNKPIDPKNTNFLREGPYPNLVTFCRICHGQKDLSRLNPHELMLKPDGGSNLDSCFFCHTTAPSTEVTIKMQESDFHIPPASLCTGCHTDAPHAGVLEHSVKIEGEKLDRLHQKEQELGIAVPLSSEGKIICVSCHNPHPEQINIKNSIQDTEPGKNFLVDQDYFSDVTEPQINKAFEEVSKEQELFPLIGVSNKPGRLLRLPITGGKICLACHDQP